MLVIFIDDRGWIYVRERKQLVLESKFFSIRGSNRKNGDPKIMCSCIR